MTPPLSHSVFRVSKWAISAQNNSDSKSPKMTLRLGHTGVGARQLSRYLSSTNNLEALCNLALSESLASWSHGVAKWARDAKISQVGATVNIPRHCFGRVELRTVFLFKKVTMAVPQDQAGDFNSPQAKRYDPHFRGHIRGESGRMVAKPNSNITISQGGLAPLYVLAKNP